MVKSCSQIKFEAVGHKFVDACCADPLFNFVHPSFQLFCSSTKRRNFKILDIQNFGPLLLSKCFGLWGSAKVDGRDGFITFCTRPVRFVWGTLSSGS